MREKSDDKETSGTDLSQEDFQCGATTIVSCGPRHFSSLIFSPECINSSSTNTTVSSSPAMAIAKDLMKSHAVKHGQTKDSAEAMLQIWGYVDNDHDSCSSKIERAIQRTLSAFQKNNFGIVNALHSVIGEGVYPCAALLNHSCCPNSILRYELGVACNTREHKYQPPILQIVACRDISAGEEISHSYVDLALCTQERQRRLLDTHGFMCECLRCKKGGCLVELPEKRADWVFWPLIKERHTQEGKTASQSKPNLQKLDLDDAISGCRGLSENEAHIIQKSRLLQQKSNQCMVEGDASGELHYLEEAKGLYLTRSSEGGKYLSPFHNQLYSVRCSYLSALLANGQLHQALKECEHIVSFLAVAFSHVQNHPLLGLQLYTLGDLYSAAATMEDGGSVEEASCSFEKKSKVAYTWALRVMMITHGANNPMVQILNENISTTNEVNSN